MSESKIEWTGSTWNPVVGCFPVSSGCQHCYAQRMARRLACMAEADIKAGRKPGGKDKYREVLLQSAPDWRFKAEWNGRTVGDKAEMLQPLRWKKARRIFVASMGDLFHDTVPFETLAAVFGVMAICPQHTFQVLTKRPERIQAFFEWVQIEKRGQMHGEQGFLTDHLRPKVPDSMFHRGWRQMKLAYHGPDPATSIGDATAWPWPLPNAWIGATVENADYVHRIDALRGVAAAVRFLSIEPMLGPMPNLNLDGIDWVIGGGESGPGARPMHPVAIRGLRDQCAAAGVPFFFKQWGDSIASGAVAAGYRVKEKKGGRMLDGVRHDAYPEARP